VFQFRRPVRFAEVDAARLVFFARYLDYCHDALEALFAELPGGYPALTMTRDIGIPTVRVESTFSAPLRYGDIARFDVEVLRLGNTSVTVRHTVRRERDAELCATIEQVFITARLSSLEPVPLPPDVRALFGKHLVSGASIDSRSHT
jgi:YbgC/YbaW family acyl-CoA thioester hydrolase